MYVNAAGVVLKFLNRWNMNARYSRVAQTGEPHRLDLFSINIVDFNVCVCVTEVGCSWGGTRLVTRDLHTSIY